MMIGRRAGGALGVEHTKNHSQKDEAEGKTSKFERLVDGLEQINRCVTAFFGIIALFSTILLTYSVLQQFRSPPSGKHECTTCHKTFLCKGKSNTKKQNIHRFKRKTVQVGSFPLEVTQAENQHDFCCGKVLSNGVHARFCSFNCYLSAYKAEASHADRSRRKGNEK